MTEELLRQDNLIRELTTRGSSDVLNHEPKYGEGTLQLLSHSGTKQARFIFLCFFIID